ncbi:MAG: U32 family peptidase [Desulfobulbaceae bacterium]|nr:U32 family peptidase [Desulfobulbaceae bacterium]
MKMELLAPAGTIPAFEAALAEGADAVYLGAPVFNARALARDFSFAEIAAMIQSAHDQGKKVYLAMNSLIKEEELRLALETLGRIEQMQADALIVQDLGLVHLARRFFPQLPLHASTLMAAHNSVAVEYFAALGCKRVVLARELHLREIGHIAQLAGTIGVELELFVHGAMCFSYSGLCRFSSLHGGRSSLRGQCVQPCRRRYQWLSSGQSGKSAASDGGYFFSMNDLSGIEQLDTLTAAGVASLKIEGRLKSVAYVRNTVRAYRLALDAREENDSKHRARLLKEAQDCLDAAMGRRRSSGFFLDGAESGSELISPERSGNTGILAGMLQGMETVRHQGKVVAVQLLVQLRTPVSAGDRLRLHEERSDTRISFTLRVFRVAGKARRRAQAGEIVEIRVQDARLGALRPPFHGKLYRVDESGRREQISSALARLIVERKSMPMSAGFAEALLQGSAGTNLPAHRSKEKIDQRQSGQTDRRSRSGNRRLNQIQWWLQATSPEVLRLRYPFPVSRLLLELSAENVELALAGHLQKFLRSTKLTWALPPVIIEERLAWFRQTIERLQAASFNSFQLGHPGQLCLFAAAHDGDTGKQTGLELFGDYTFNLLNRSAIAAMAWAGFSGVQFSMETDRSTIMAALAATPDEWESSTFSSCAVGLLVYGRPALFTSRSQAPHFKGRYSLVSPHGERYFLREQHDSVYVYPHQPFSLLAHSRELADSGLNYLVVDLSRGNPKREAALIMTLMGGRAAVLPHFSGNYSGVLA